MKENNSDSRGVLAKVATVIVFLFFWIGLLIFHAYTSDLTWDELLDHLIGKSKNVWSCHMEHPWEFLVATLKPILSWVQAHKDTIYMSFSGLIPTLLGTWLVIRHGKKQTRKKIMEEEIDKPVPKQELLKIEGQNSDVPQEITFSDKFLIVPSLVELGFPKPLAFFPHYIEIPENIPGQWVNPGDTLLRAKLFFFPKKSKPKNKFHSFTQSIAFSWYDWVARFSPIEYEITLESPIRGLLIYNRSTFFRLGINPYKIGNDDEYNFRAGMIFDKPRLPCLLIPNSETEIDDIHMECFRDEMYSQIVNNWKRNVHAVYQPGGEFKKMRVENAIKQDNFFNSKSQEREMSEWIYKSEELKNEYDKGALFKDKSEQWPIISYNDLSPELRDWIEVYLFDLKREYLDLSLKLTHLKINRFRQVHKRKSSGVDPIVKTTFPYRGG